MDAAVDHAREAVELWLETVIDDGGIVPAPNTITHHQQNPDFKGWVWAVIDVDLSQLSDKAQRINITLPSRILRRIDAAAKAMGETRSGYIARQVLA